MAAFNASMAALNEIIKVQKETAEKTREAMRSKLSAGERAAIPGAIRGSVAQTG